jgi:hypothetical protein
MDSTFFFRVCRQELLANGVRTIESDHSVRHGVVVFFQMPIVFGGGRGALRAVPTSALSLFEAEADTAQGTRVTSGNRRDVVFVVMKR